MTKIESKKEPNKIIGNALNRSQDRFFFQCVLDATNNIVVIITEQISVRINKNMKTLLLYINIQCNSG